MPLFSLATTAVLVLGACGNGGAKVTTTSSSPAASGAGVVELVFDLKGSSEVPGPGDPDGSGLGSVTLKRPENQVCFFVEVDNIAAATATHIHQGARGAAGDIVVTLGPPTKPGPPEAPPTVRKVDGCKSANAALIERLATDPSAFYVNVHTADHPDGAVRGQLGARS